MPGGRRQEPDPTGEALPRTHPRVRRRPDDVGDDVGDGADDPTTVGERHVDLERAARTRGDGVRGTGDRNSTVAGLEEGLVTERTWGQEPPHELRLTRALHIGA